MVDIDKEVHTSNSLVNPTHFRDGTLCFLLEGNNDWWDEERQQSRKSNARQRCYPVFLGRMVMGYDYEENEPDREDGWVDHQG